MYVLNAWTHSGKIQVKNPVMFSKQHAKRRAEFIRTTNNRSNGEVLYNGKLIHSW